MIFTGFFCMNPILKAHRTFVHLRKLKKLIAMKRILLFTATLCISGVAMSQITVTQWNVAGPSNIVTTDRDTLPTAPAPTGGANQTWDYSANVTAHEQETMTFAAPGWLNNSSYFPTATLGATDANGFEIYLINDASSLRTVGIAADIFGTGDKQIYVDPADVIAQWPMNYNNAYQTNSYQHFSFAGSEVGAPVDSIVQQTWIEKDVVVDAWGSLSTPYGTFPALRNSTMQIQIDSTWGYVFGMGQLLNDNIDTSYMYEFWTDDANAKFPLMEMSHDNAGTLYSVSWLTAAPTQGINEVAGIDVSVYPNPTSDNLFIDVSDEDIATVEIYNNAGQLVSSIEVKDSKTTIDVSAWDNGIYLYKLRNSFGEEVISDKFVVQK